MRLKLNRSVRAAAIFVILWLFASLLVLARTTSSAEAATERVDIVALGDSFTAGNGAGNYYGPAGCYESYNNYSHQFEQRLETYGQSATINVVACSGAKTVNIASQVSQLSTSTRSEADLVLLTIGGNDAKFRDIVSGCMGLQSENLCKSAIDYASSMIPTIRTRTRAVLMDLAVSFPGATIALVGYPYLIDRCPSASFWDVGYLTTSQYPAGEQIRSLGLLADSMQRSLVTDLSGSYPGRLVQVSMLDPFAGHEVCGSDEHWINYFFEGDDPNVLDVDQWLHPNALGHGAIANTLFQRRNSLGIGDGSSPPPTLPTGSYVYANLPLACGVVAPYASTYGLVGLPGGGTYNHANAIDLPVSAGTSVAAPATGQAVVGWDPDGYGNYVDITDSSGRVHRMAHMQATGLLSGNRRVVQGQLIGRVGATGFATGPHLHYEQLASGVMKPLLLAGPAVSWGATDSSGNRYTTHKLVSGNCSEVSSPYRHDEVKFHRWGTTFMINGVTDEVHDLWTGVMPGAIRVECDINGDGESEIYSAEYRNDRWYVMQGTWGKTGEDRGWRVFTSDLNGHTIQGLSCGDRDGDGKDEVKLHVSGSFIYIVNAATGETSVLFSGIMKPQFFLECNTDGNSTDEIYSAEYRSGVWYVMRGVRPNAETRNWRTYSTDFYGHAITGMSCGDIDGDGVDEVKVHLSGGFIRRINSGGSTTILYTGIATPNFRVECDTNGDGADEIISVERRGIGWYIMQGERVGVGDYRWTTFYDGYHAHPIEALTCGDKNDL